MIYNENGIILNEEYVLESYFNNSYIDSIINESFKDPKTKFGKTVKAAWDWLVKKVGEFCQWLVNIPNRSKIKANKEKIKNILKSEIKSNSDILNMSDRHGIKLKGEIAKYINSKGYNRYKWIGTFNNAINNLLHSIEKGRDFDIHKLKKNLYDDGQFEIINEDDTDWFKRDIDNTTIYSLYNDTIINEIVDFAINASELSKPLKQTHNDIIKFNRKLDKDAKIDIEVIKEINHYFTQAMSSIRNLSYACITVCMNALKNNLSDSIETHKINDMSDEDKIEFIKSSAHNADILEIIKNPSEKVQLAAVESNGANIKYIDNPSEEVQLASIKSLPSSILYIKNASPKVRENEIKNINPWALKKFNNNITDDEIKCVIENLKKENNTKGIFIGLYKCTQDKIIAMDPEFKKYLN